jgi:hypothetical protein
MPFASCMLLQPKQSQHVLFIYLSTYFVPAKRDMPVTVPIMKPALKWLARLFGMRDFPESYIGPESDSFIVIFVILRTASKHIPGQHIELSHGRNL